MQPSRDAIEGRPEIHRVGPHGSTTENRYSSPSAACAATSGIPPSRESMGCVRSVGIWTGMILPGPPDTSQIIARLRSMLRCSVYRFSAHHLTRSFASSIFSCGRGHRAAAIALRQGTPSGATGVEPSAPAGSMSAAGRRPADPPHLRSSRFSSVQVVASLSLEIHHSEQRVPCEPARSR